MSDYPTNLSDGQWQVISKYIDLERNRKHSLREIVNAILYLVKAGIQWRMMPNDFPKWPIVYCYFAKWKKEKMVESWKKIIKVFADGGYRGKLIESIKAKFAITLEIVKRNELYTFKILPKRWIVERTFAWIDASRRTSKNYERLNDTSVAIVQIPAIRIMINRF